MFPSAQVRDLSLFTNIVVDVKDPKGKNTFAYVADTTTYKMVVYDFKNDDSWTVDQAYFYPYPNKAHFLINRVNFDLMDGVIGLALGNTANKLVNLHVRVIVHYCIGWYAIFVFISLTRCY